MDSSTNTNPEPSLLCVHEERSLESKGAHRARVRSNYAHGAPWRLPQLDGTHEEDESTRSSGSSSSSDDDGESSSEDSSASEAHPDPPGTGRARGGGSTRGRRGRPPKTLKAEGGRRKADVQVGRKSKSSSPSGGAKGSTSTRGERSSRGRSGVTSGRTLRSRERLPKLEQKQQEFKCTLCKKPFPSKGSVNRHSRWCKPRKTKATPKPKALADEASAITVPAKKRGRPAKVKVTEDARSDTVKVVPTASNEVSEAVAVSNQNPELPKATTVCNEIIKAAPVNNELSKTATISNEVEVSETGTVESSKPGEPQVQVETRPVDLVTAAALPSPPNTNKLDLLPTFGDEGKPVRCERCKHTYRTQVSYKKHLNNCLVYSSSSGEEEGPEIENANNTEAAEPAQSQTAVRSVELLQDQEAEASDSDSSTSSEESESNDEAAVDPNADTENKTIHWVPESTATVNDDFLTHDHSFNSDVSLIPVLQASGPETYYDVDGLSEPETEAQPDLINFHQEALPVALIERPEPEGMEIVSFQNPAHSQIQQLPLPIVSQIEPAQTIFHGHPDPFQVIPNPNPEPLAHVTAPITTNDDLDQRRLQEILSQFQNNKDFTIRLKESDNTFQPPVQVQPETHALQEGMDSTSMCSPAATVQAPASYSLPLEQNLGFTCSLNEPRFSVPEPVQQEQLSDNSSWNGSSAYQVQSSLNNEAQIRTELFEQVQQQQQTAQTAAPEILQPTIQTQTVTFQTPNGQLVTVQIPIAPPQQLNQLVYAHQYAVPGPQKQLEPEVNLRSYQEIQEAQLQQFRQQQIQAAEIQHQLEQAGLYLGKQEEPLNQVTAQQQQQQVIFQQQPLESSTFSAPSPVPVQSYQSPPNNITYMVVQHGNGISTIPIPYRAHMNPVPFQPELEPQRYVQAQTNADAGAPSQDCYPQALSTSNSTPVPVCCTANSTPQISSATNGGGARPCPCSDCHQRIFYGPGPPQKPKVPIGSRKQSKQLGNFDWGSGSSSPKRTKLQRERAELAAERQGQGLLLYNAMTSPSPRPLPKLLPAITQSTSAVTVIHSEPVSSTILPPEKTPAPNPNIAVVHPLQKMSDQVLQIESTFTAANNSNSRLIPENWMHPPNGTYAPAGAVASSTATAKLAQELADIQASLGTGGPVNGSVNPPAQEPSVIPPVPIEEPIVPETESPVPIGSERTSPEVPAPPPAAKKSIKITLKRQEGADSYSLMNISESGNQPAGTMRSLKIKGKITSGEQAGSTTDVVVRPIVHTVPIPDPDAQGFESNRTIVEEEEDGSAGQPKRNALTHRAVIVYEVKLNEAVVFRSSDVRSVWGYIFETVQGRRLNHNLPPLAYPATNISLPGNKREAAASFNQLGLAHRAVQFLLEQLPGINKAAKENHVFKFHKAPTTASVDDTPAVSENPSGCSRSEGYAGRKAFDMFGWLASKHRAPLEVDSTGKILDSKSTGLSAAMKFRNLGKLGTKHLGVYRSRIHGRGLFTTKEIESGELIIEYAGEVIRSLVCELRENYYQSKGIGCYMFRIDDDFVVDATLRGNAARFINHSCEPNCRSRIMDILGQKHIVIIALRRITPGEELTYDYKFPYEEVKIPCTCWAPKCRKFLN